MEKDSVLFIIKVTIYYNKKNRFNLCKMYPSHHAYGEIGLRSLIKLALNIRSKKEMYNDNPIYITDPLTNKKKNKF